MQTNCERVYIIGIKFLRLRLQYKWIYVDIKFQSFVDKNRFDGIELINWVWQSWIWQDGFDKEVFDRIAFDRIGLKECVLYIYWVWKDNIFSLKVYETGWCVCYREEGLS